MLSFGKVHKGLLQSALTAVLAAPLVLGLQAQSAPGQQTPAAQTPPPAPEPAAQIPTFRTDINFVRVDVIVADKQGNPVGDLLQQDFEVTEDGKPQTIQAFRLVNVNEGGTSTEQPRPIRNSIDEQTEAARDDVRLFAVFLDDYHVRLENSFRAKEPIAQFIENQLQASDMAGIMYPLWSINDVLLTRNRRDVAGAIRGFTGRKYDYTARNAFEERYVNFVSTMDAERIRTQVTLSALKGLIVRLGGLREGRKAIILVSEGFTNVLPSQAQDPVASMPGSGGPMQPDPIGPGTNAQQARLDSAEFFLKTDMMNDLQSVYELANRNNITIYTVDPRGLATYEFSLDRPNISPTRDQSTLDNTMDSLRILADRTDGRAIVNQNDLTAGLRQIVRDSSAYYLIGYTSSLTEQDGKFHKINVRVKRPGVQVRAREGYMALTAREAERSLMPPKPGPPPAVVAALGTLAIPARRSLIRTWVGMSPGTGGKTRVSFIWTPTPAPPGVRREIPAKVSLVAGSASSDLYYRGRALAPGRVDFEVPPGPIELDIAVEDAAAAVLDRETRKIVVPSLGLGLTLSTPEVFRAGTVREWQTFASDTAAVPVPEREFRRTDRLLLRVGAQSAAGTPAITARLLNREGSEMAVLPVSAAGFGGLSNIDAPLAALPLGEFLIEVKASDGGEQTTALVAFRLIP